MARTVNIATRDWAVGVYSREIDLVPADAVGVLLQFDMAEWPPRYYPDPAGPLGRWEVGYSADGAVFERIGEGELWTTQNPRNGVTLVTIRVPFQASAEVGSPRRNPNVVRGTLTVLEPLRTPVRMGWLTAAEFRQG